MFSRLARSLFKRPSIIASYILAISSSAFAQAPTEISITTFNIKFYGLNGNHGGSPGTEARDAKIRNHLTTNDLWTDVMVFQEIVDVAALERMVGEHYKCQSYDNHDPRHQHVVICFKDIFTFEKARDDDNFIIDEVALEKHRPAVHGVLTWQNRPLLHVFGVHLKAQPDQTDVRTEQTHLIADYLERRENDEPVVILGDFNTHNNDHVIMNDIFSRNSINLREAPISQKYTYRVPVRGAKLDRIWISSDLRLKQQVNVVGPCNAPNNARPIRTYNSEVSDHCPVTLKVALNQQNQ